MPLLTVYSKLIIYTSTQQNKIFMKVLKTILSIFTLLSVISCVNSDIYGTPDLSGECSTLAPTKQVLDITSQASDSYKKYEEDDIIEAYVTSSDEGGNFYKSISLVSIDGKTGFSMPVDDYNLYTKFEPGRKVYVNMKDRYFVKEYGSTVIGSLYNGNTPEVPSDDEVGRISGVVYQDVIKGSCSKINEDDIVIRLNSVKEAENDSYLNKLIEFENVEFKENDPDKTYFDSNNQIGGATNNLLMDVDGNVTTFRVSSFASFGLNKRPTGSGKVRGVMTKYRTFYQFMPRTENDVQLNNPRFIPAFNETFDSNLSEWINFSVTGAQVWKIETRFGNPAPCVVITGFASSTSNENEDWLITPAQDFSTASSATLSFDSATRFNGNAITVLISKNYSGSGNPALATWTPLTATLAPVNSNFVWTNSGVIDISAYTGTGNNKVYVAFKYTSTTSASATWELDNVKIITK
jgi:hypothetical protein